MGTTGSGSWHDATTTRTYDAGRRAQTQTDADGLTVSWTYTTDHSLGSETCGSNSTVYGGWCYSYNGAFQMTAMTLGTGTPEQVRGKETM